MEKPTVLLIDSFLTSASHKPCFSAELAGRLISAGWQVLTASARLNRLIRLLDMLRAAWSGRRRYQVACVAVYSGLPFLWAEATGWLLRWLGKPHILALHGGALPEFARRHPERVRRLLQGAQAVTVPSPYLLEQMKPYRPDLQVIPNPVALSDFPFRQRQMPKPELIWLRAFENIYNPALAARAVGLLAAEFPALRLTMIGPDSGDGSLQRTQQAAAELGVAERITYPGRIARAQVPAWLDRGDIFLNTTFVDNAPVSVLEAMACGLAVVSTCVGGVPYLLEDGREALLVPPDEPAAMASAIRRLLCEPGLSERLTRAAYQKVSQCDWAAILPRWQELLQTVAANSHSNR